MMKTIQQSFRHELICEEHHVYGFMPCAWPECRNGLEENGFRLRKPISPSEDDIYLRQQWLDPAGDPYYSWESGTALPSWFSIDGIVGQEARRRGIRERILANLIYHYTSLHGLTGILESQELWLTDYGYLSDSQELGHGLKLFEDALSVALKTEKFSAMSEILAAWKVGLTDHKHRICVTSYSLDGDSLSQWRAYGNVAIGFKPSFELTGPSGECQFDSVIYDPVNQQRIIEFYLNHVLQAYQLDMARDDAEQAERMRGIYRRSVSKLVNMSALFKNRAFAEEKEVRVAYVEDPSLFESLPLKPAPKRFRATDRAIVPYVTTADISRLREKGRLPIREVVAGPSISEVAKNGIRELLEHHGYFDVLVRSSEAPFRG